LCTKFFCTRVERRTRRKGRKKQRGREGHRGAKKKKKSFTSPGNRKKLENRRGQYLKRRVAQYEGGPAKKSVK